MVINLIPITTWQCNSPPNNEVGSNAGETHNSFLAELTLGFLGFSLAAPAAIFGCSNDAPLGHSHHMTSAEVSLMKLKCPWIPPKIVLPIRLLRKDRKSSALLWPKKKKYPLFWAKLTLGFGKEYPQSMSFLFHRAMNVPL